MLITSRLQVTVDELKKEVWFDHYLLASMVNQGERDGIEMNPYIYAVSPDGGVNLFPVYVVAIPKTSMLAIGIQREVITWQKYYHEEDIDHIIGELLNSAVMFT